MKRNYNVRVWHNNRMFNVCPHCGQYSVEKEVRPLDPRRAEALCPQCGYAHPFLRFPLLLVSGASGTGKTRLCLELAGIDRDFVHLETDILWGVVPAGPEDNYRSYRNAWLRIAKNIHQGGRPAVLYGSATASQFEACPERRYFGPIFLLALTCRPEILTQRLRERPVWRGAGEQAFIESMLSFNEVLIGQAAQDPALERLDTSDLSPRETAQRARRWLEGHFASQSLRP